MEPKLIPASTLDAIVALERLGQLQAMVDHGFTGSFMVDFLSGEGHRIRAYVPSETMVPTLRRELGEQLEHVRSIVGDV